MTALVPATLLALAALVLVHAATPSLRFLNGSPRSVWLSAAGGVSVAYVFVHFMPELAESRDTVARPCRPAAGPKAQRKQEPRRAYRLPRRRRGPQRPEGGGAERAEEPLLGLRRRRGGIRRVAAELVIRRDRRFCGYLAERYGR